MKVLVADTFEKSGLAGLTTAGCEVVYQPDAKDESLSEAIRSLDTERQRLAAAARSRVEDAFDIRKVIPRIEEFYRAL